MTLLDLLCSVHEQQYIHIINKDTSSRFNYDIEGSAAYIIRAYDFDFYLQKVEKVTPAYFKDKLVLQVSF